LTVEFLQRQNQLGIRNLKLGIIFHSTFLIPHS
jgi:hypothetical protein